MEAIADLEAVFPPHSPDTSAVVVVAENLAAVGPLTGSHDARVRIPASENPGFEAAVDEWHLQAVRPEMKDEACIEELLEVSRVVRSRFALEGAAEEDRYGRVAEEADRKLWDLVPRVQSLQSMRDNRTVVGRDAQGKDACALAGCLAGRDCNAGIEEESRSGLAVAKCSLEQDRTHVVDGGCGDCQWDGHKEMKRLAFAAVNSYTGNLTWERG